MANRNDTVLQEEIMAVEKILELLKIPNQLEQAQHLCLSMMALPLKYRTDSFDFVDINELICYQFDIKKAQQNNDFTEAARLEKISNAEFLAQVLNDLGTAKSTLNSHTTSLN